MIELKSEVEIGKMRAAGAVVAEILRELAAMVEPGVTTAELDSKAERMISLAGCRSAFKNYQVGDAVYPAVLCASVNDEVVHGIPSDRPIEEGDLVSLDFGVEKEGYYGDSAVTVVAGDTDEQSRRLVEVTRRSMEAGIEQMRPGQRLGDVGAAVQEVAEGGGFSVVRSFVGHGIGRALHEDPQLPNFGKRGRGQALRVGMVLAIEPMINAGGYGVRVKEDGWTAVTTDGSRSAHFEHTVAITDEGPQVLTAVAEEASL